MTLVCAWVRRRKATRELFVASDSRLRSNGPWDIGTKVLDLGRGDSLMAFAGHTYDAYPLMLQLQTAVSMHSKVSSRATDLVDLKGHVIKLFNHMWERDVEPGRPNTDPAEARFLLCGFSWRMQDFKIWTVEFHKRTSRFQLREASRHRKRGGGNKYFCFVGDGAGTAMNQVYSLLKERSLIARPDLDMEPLEVLLEAIRDESLPSIGGPPQVWKVYRHMNTLPMNVYWPDRHAGTLAFGGRVLMSFERNGYLALDPATMNVDEPTWPNPHPPCQHS